MLAIKKRHNAVKAITAGSLAFAIGLMGVTAVIGDNFQPDTPVFNREQSTDPTKDPVPVADTSGENQNASQDTGSGGATGAAPATGSSWSTSAPATSLSATTPSSTIQAPATSTTTTPVGSTTTTTQPAATTDTATTTAPTGTTTTPTNSGGTTSDPTCTTLCVSVPSDPLPNLGL